MKAGSDSKQPLHFATRNDFYLWLEKNSEHATMLWVGYYKKDSGFPSLTWQESVDAALCFGWIDGIRKRVDEISYAIRFTPRKPESNWSAINISRMKELEDMGLMRDGGKRAFQKRKEEKSRIYSYEQRHSIQLEDKLERKFRKQAKAWKFFQAQPASYRSLMRFYIMSAKQEETRQKRLDRLIEESLKGRRIR